MLLRNIALRNIRSYNDGGETKLELPDGVVLFEGDIGSGKSTLLYALEFALFGFSDMKGPHLLSEKRKEGRVSVTFESGGTEYTVDRRLKLKGDDVVQEECYISTAGSRTRLSPSDLKERVVSILGFNEPTHPKAESLVYRFAVFTPQEQMKEILLKNPEERLHVIRRVLGAQSYQAAAENSDLVAKRIKELAYGLKKASEDLEEKKGQLEEKSKTVARLESEIPRLQEKAAGLTRLVKSLEAEWKESLGQWEALGKDEAKIPLLKKEVAEFQEEVSEQESNLRGHEARLSEELEPLVKIFEARPKPDSTAKELDGRLSVARERLTKLEGTKKSLEDDLAKTRDLLSKGVCPMCGQKIAGDVHARTEHSEEELKKLGVELEDATSSVEALAELLDAARSYEEDEREYARAVREKTRVDSEIKAARKKIQQLNGRLSVSLSELAQIASRVKAMRGLSDQMTGLESRLNQARSDDKDAALGLNQAQTEFADTTKELQRLSAEVEEKKAWLDEARRLTSYQGWLSSFFRPTVELIEKQTLAQAAARFNDHFQRFFSSLVDDPDMVVRVKEDFSPLFEREGFEQDFEALSGGERTSMALAYRFALNSVVRESVSARPELVILDEPTDGFSKEQVYKMRGLLQALDSRQVILVSHERELESMADHVFRVEKRNGTSVVSGSRGSSQA
jgi:DNA repair exonuclease SbcCD ATPase subunit